MRDWPTRDDFPLLRQHPDLVFLDSAATTQKPTAVIDAERKFYEESYANIHRAHYDMAEAATVAFEGVRQKAADFCGAAAEEIIFVANATQALNLAAEIETQRLQAGDEIIVAVTEHHSNLLPWQRAAHQTGAKLRWVGIDNQGCFDREDFYRQLSDRTAVVAVAHVSNIVGAIAPVAEIIAAAHRLGARVVVDAAQSAARLPIQVQNLNVDYMAFSGHKMYGPTGTGWLYARHDIVSEATPPQTGGGTVLAVQRDGVQWQAAPWRFEAGTPNIAGTIGLGAALDFLSGIGMDQVQQHDQAIAAYLRRHLAELPARVLGPDSPGPAVCSFVVESGRPVHSHDVAEILNQHQVAIRGGHHCAQLMMHALGMAEVARASAGIYTTEADIDRLIAALEQVRVRFQAAPARI